DLNIVADETRSRDSRESANPRSSTDENRTIGRVEHDVRLDDRRVSLLLGPRDEDRVAAEDRRVRRRRLWHAVRTARESGETNDVARELLRQVFDEVPDVVHPPALELTDRPRSRVEIVERE